MNILRSSSALLVALLATTPAFSADITADLWQDFDFTTLNTTNLAANDHVTGGTWTITDASSNLSTSTSAEKISTGLISGNSDSGGTRGLRYDNPSGTFEPGVVTYEYASTHTDISFGFWFKFPAEYVGSFEGGQPDILYVENVTGVRELYIKLEDANQATLYLFTAEAGESTGIDVEPDTWYWITAQYGATHSMEVYDEAGTQVGTTVTRTGNTAASTIANLGNLIGDEDGGGPFDYDDWVMDWADATFPLGPPLVEVIADVEQEGFRWGVDDNIEALHGFEAAQDTSVTIDDNQSRLLRAIVNAQAIDPATAAYTLRYLKNGSGVYVAVPVGTTSAGTTPLIEAGDATESGNNTASTSWAVSYPNASTGDLLIFCIAWDDSTTTTDVTEPAGPNSEALSEINATPATDSGTETRTKCWYTVATGSWTASTLTFTPDASEQWTAAVIRVPAGEFDSSTPVGGSGVNNTAGSADTLVLNAAFTAGASDGSGKLITWASADVDPQTVASGWAEVANEDRGAVSGGFFTRNTAVSNSESISAGTVSTIAGDSWTSVSFVVRAPVVNNEVYVTTSGNIAAGGEVTTARLTAPAGKSSVTDFVVGRRWDDENGSDSIDITNDDYTEVEWLVALSATPVSSDFFDFRVYSGSAELEVYTVTPRWTIPSAGGSSVPVKMRLYQQMRRQFVSEDAANDDCFYLRACGATP